MGHLRPGGTLRSALLAVACLGVAVILGFGLHRSVLPLTHAATESRSPDLPGIRAVVLRTLMLGSMPAGVPSEGTAQPAESGISVWTGTLARGERGLSDLLHRNFTGTRFLMFGDDDASFVAALFSSVLDRQPDEEEMASALTYLDGGGSPIGYLSDFLESDEVLSACTELGILPGRIDPSVLSAAASSGTPDIVAAADSALPLPGTYAFGLRTATGSVSFGGLTGRIDLLVDGRPLGGHAVPSAPSPWEPEPYRIDWDASLEASGDHDVVMLARRADGRALRVDGGTVRVPVLRTIETGGILPGSFQDGGMDDFYRTTSEGGLVAFHAVFPDTQMTLTAYDATGTPMEASTTEGSGYASIRLRAPLGQEMYFRATRESGGGSSYHAVLGSDAASVSTYGGAITLRADAGSDSEAVGRLSDRTVVSLGEEKLDGDGDPWFLVRTGEQYGYASAAALRLLRFDGRLDALTLSLPEIGFLPLWPSFEAETVDFGLVLDASFVRLALGLSTREASFASLEITMEDAAGDSTVLSSEAAFDVPPGESVLRIRVTSADSLQIVEYRIHLLRGASGDGFSPTLGDFPKSYRSALWLQHRLHPLWIFEPFDSPVRFQDFLNAQGVRDRSLVPFTEVPASFVEAGSPVYDGKTWKAATDAAIAHFADPRSFLLEKEVFQFERLVFLDDVHTAEGVRTILEGSFFADPVVDTDGTPIDFAELFLDAGRESGLSPYFLATRALQEMGMTGTQLGHGTLAGYEGLFNFYNIGSTPDPSIPDGARINGARFARFGYKADELQLTEEEKSLLLPWISRSLSIRGGAFFLKTGYVGRGQDTQYLQKFDLIAEDGLFTHQYAQNLLAARSEGRRQYAAYRRMDLLDRPFVFRIPFFTDMPDEAAAEPE